MKRLGTKMLSLLLAIMMVLPLAACGGSGGGSGEEGEAASLRIVAADFGFGVNWLKSLAQVYMSQHKNVTISVEGTAIPHQLRTQIQGGLSTYDMFFGTSILYRDGEDGIFLNLDDVFAATPEGEDRTVEEKLGSYASSVIYNGHYYELPYINAPEAMIVNHDTMRSLYGDNYKLPNTTDEFMALCDDIKAKGAYPFIDSFGYTTELIETWWNQYDEASYRRYFNGLYLDENGQEQQALNGESLEQPGKLKAFKLADKLLNVNNGYNHKYAPSMDFAEAQLAFCGQGYGGIDNKLIAFMPNGAWFENEMEMVLAQYPTDIKMFRVPVFSDIVEMLPDKSVSDDAELSALIDAIDAGDAALSGKGYEVTQSDYDYVARARSFTSHVTTGHEAGIVATCKAPDVAKDFLVFLASDAASKIAAKELQGLTLPFGYLPTEADAEISDFVKSVNEVSNGAEYIKDYNNTVLCGNGLSLSKIVGATLCTTMITGNKSAQEIYDEDVAKFTADWKYLLGTSE